MKNTQRNSAILFSFMVLIIKLNWSESSVNLFFYHDNVKEFFYEIKFNSFIKID